MAVLPPVTSCDAYPGAGGKVKRFLTDALDGPNAACRRRIRIIVIAGVIGLVGLGCVSMLPQPDPDALRTMYM